MVHIQIWCPFLVQLTQLTSWHTCIDIILFFLFVIFSLHFWDNFNGNKTFDDNFNFGKKVITLVQSTTNIKAKHMKDCFCSLYWWQVAVNCTVNKHQVCNVNQIKELRLHSEGYIGQFNTYIHPLLISKVIIIHLYINIHTYSKNFKHLTLTK